MKKVAQSRTAVGGSLQRRGYAAAIDDAKLMLRVIDQAIAHGILIAKKSPCHRKIKAIRAALRHNVDIRDAAK